MGPGVSPQQCYIRVSVGLPCGTSPGIPYVMEIWPPGHFSPIHNHGNAFGVVRLLHGSISSALHALLHSSSAFLMCFRSGCPAVDCRIQSMAMPSGMLCTLHRAMTDECSHSSLADSLPCSSATIEALQGSHCNGGP